MPESLYCPECGAPMVLRQTQKHTYRNGQPRYFYGCSRWPECSGTHGAHPDGKPLGVPADARTKWARGEAHRAFDALWQRRGWSRRAAYRYLDGLMGMERGAAHIGNFSWAECDRLVRALTGCGLSGGPEALKKPDETTDILYEAEQAFVRRMKGP